jgi:lipopolysaccharide transport system permease protein
VSTTLPTADAPRGGSGARPVVITPPQRLVFPDLVDLWRHRNVFWILVWRNVTRRYRQTLLGPLWFVVNPLVRMVLFSLVLGRVAGLPSEGVPYPIFTYTALLPWQLFASGVTRSTGCLVSYHGIISKVYFPRLILPAAEVMTALADFLLSFGILLGMMWFYDFSLSPKILTLPLFLGLAMTMALGVGLVMGPLQAHYRDTSNFVTYIVQFWFYGTPVAYASSVLLDRVPSWVSTLYVLNPMNGVVEGFRWALLDTGRAPDATFWMSCVFALVVLSIGSLIFLRAEQSIVDLA